MRTFVPFLLAAALQAVATPAPAQAPWPGHPIKIITPSPVGVGSDLFARAYAERLSEALNTPVYVENKPGALSVTGTDAVAKSRPDGYTVLFSTSNPFAITPFLFSRLPYDPQADFVAVTQALRGGSFIVANNAVPIKSVPDLVAAARREPGRISYASYGSGSTAHLGFELLQDASGARLLHVPYKRAALPDVMAGHVMLGFEPPVSALPAIRSGKLTAIAYTGNRRSAVLPDVPTVAESYPGVEIFTSLGFWVPAGTPASIVERLNREIQAVTHSAGMQRMIAEAGLEPMSTTPAEAAAAIRRETEVMGRLIKAKGITVD